MILLIGGEHELLDLKKVSGLSKNATVNHLNKLLKAGIVCRVSRGHYALTQDGLEFTLAGIRLYMDSFHQEELDKKKITPLFAKDDEKTANLERRTVNNKGSYLCSRISFDGAVAGALRAQGIDCDLADVAGRSGYAFLFNVPKGRMSPSAPTSFEVSVYREFTRGVNELGIAADIWMEKGGYVGGETVSPKDLERARDLFCRVKREIDRLGRPVVLWGLPIPEFGIVNGYEGDSYVASTFRSHELPDQEELVPSLDIKAPGALMMLTFGGNVAKEERWLERAVLMASGRAQVCEGYLSGPGAAREWGSALLKAGDDQYMANAHMAACYAEVLINAETFLKRMATGYQDIRPTPQGMLFKGVFLKDTGGEGPDRLKNELQDAAEAYSQCARSMEEYRGLFPFKFQGVLENAARERGSTLLLEISDHLLCGFQHLQEALSCRS